MTVTRALAVLARHLDAHAGDDPPGDAAGQLTDTLDSLELSQPLDAAPEGASAVDALSLNDGGSPGMRLLAEIARVHRAVQVGGGSRPETLFRWSHLEVLRPLGTGELWRGVRRVGFAVATRGGAQVGPGRGGNAPLARRGAQPRARPPSERAHHPRRRLARARRGGSGPEQVRGRTLQEELREHGPLPPGESCASGTISPRRSPPSTTPASCTSDLKTSNVMIEDAPPPRRVRPFGRTRRGCRRCVASS